jgi:hypothetical protein
MNWKQYTIITGIYKHKNNWKLYKFKRKQKSNKNYNYLWNLIEKQLFYIFFNSVLIQIMQ